ncbi:MAG: hypothetical protein Q7U52_11625 [Hydrogenophaga sp.]|nr:hypothetical protein [Hydrogenophaga sp.]
MQRHNPTKDTILLHAGVLHRVDTRQIPADAGVSHGAMCTRQKTGCSGARGRCTNHPDCPNLDCTGHPDNTALARTPQGAELRELQDGYRVHPSERDPAAAALFWRVYIGGIVAALALITQADRIVGWLVG